MNVDNVNILSPASIGPDPSPVSPNLTLNVAISIVLGLMVGVGLAFLFEYLDQTIKSEQDVEQILGLPVMGSIMTIDTKELANQSNTPTRRGAKIGS